MFPLVPDHGLEIRPIRKHSLEGRELAGRIAWREVDDTGAIKEDKSLVELRRLYHGA